MSYATPESTASYYEEFPDLVYNPLGKTNLSVSEMGIGTYRMSNAVDTHIEALKKSLLSGINLIDTSNNYKNGTAEELIGTCIKETKVDREKIVIVSKAGYIQGHIYKKSFDEHNKAKYPEVYDINENSAHCIHPDFLQKQITDSLKRLQLHTIDIFLLHNPEYYLTWAKNNNIDKQTAQDTYYLQIQKAFKYLEEEVKAGRIQYYGVSSNTFVEDVESYTYTNLSNLQLIAKKISKENHFAVIQFPMNLCESNAITGGRNVSLIEEASQHNIGTLTNRPLNSILKNQFLKLKDVLLEENIESTAEIDPYFQNLFKIECQIERAIISRLELTKEDQDKIQDAIVMTPVFTGLLHNQHNYDTFREALIDFVLPRIEYGITLLNENIKLTEEDSKLIMDFITITNTCLSKLSSYYKVKKHHYTSALHTAIEELQPDWDHTDTLTNIAIKVLRSTKGIGCILIGMRHTDYVEHVLEQLRKKVSYDSHPQFWKNLQDKLLSISFD